MISGGKVRSRGAWKKSDRFHLGVPDGKSVRELTERYYYLKYTHLNIRTVTGAFNHGFLINVAVFSSLLMMSGGMIMPGAAIPTREGMT